MELRKHIKQIANFYENVWEIQITYSDKTIHYFSSNKLSNIEINLLTEVKDFLTTKPVNVREVKCLLKFTTTSFSNYNAYLWTHQEQPRDIYYPYIYKQVMNLYKFLNNISLKREIYFLEKKIYSRLTEKKMCSKIRWRRKEAFTFWCVLLKKGWK